MMLSNVTYCIKVRKRLNDQQNFHKNTITVYLLNPALFQIFIFCRRPYSCFVRRSHWVLFSHDWQLIPDSNILSCFQVAQSLTLCDVLMCLITWLYVSKHPSEFYRNYLQLQLIHTVLLLSDSLKFFRSRILWPQSTAMKIILFKMTHYNFKFSTGCRHHLLVHFHQLTSLSLHSITSCISANSMPCSLCSRKALLAVVQTITGTSLKSRILIT